MKKNSQLLKEVHRGGGACWRPSCPCHTEVVAEQHGGVVDTSVAIHRYVDYTIIEFPGAALALRVSGGDSVRLPLPLGWEIRA